MNKDLLKVIAGLECCSDPNGSCDLCPYDDGTWSDRCILRLDRDALEILREVEQDGLY